MQITVDDAVKSLILSEGQDYRLCTACSGPALVPLSVKPAKESDIQIKIGDNILYISKVQASYVNRVTIDMVYDPEKIFSCPVLSTYRDTLRSN